MMGYLILVCCGLGIFVLLASVFEWDWYFGHGWALWLEELFGYDMARIINAVIGVVLILRGFVRIMGII